MAKPIRIAFPLGIGDCHWSCMKLAGIRALHPGQPIHACVNESDNHKTVGYLRMVNVIDRAEKSKAAPFDINTEMPPDYRDRRWATLEGCKDWNGFDYILVANGHVESGASMDDFIPEVPTEYEYQLDVSVHAEEFQQSLVPEKNPVLLYLSGTGPNAAFHGDWWTPEMWAHVVRLLNKEDITPVVIGAPTKDDLGYYQRFMRAGGGTLRHRGIVGKTSLPVLAGLIRRAGCWVGLNSGTGIISAMMKTPTLMFWSDERYQCGPHAGFNPKMQRNWLNDEQLTTYRTFSYGSGSIGLTPENVKDVILEISRVD